METCLLLFRVSSTLSATLPLTTYHSNDHTEHSLTAPQQELDDSDDDEEVDEDEDAKAPFAASVPFVNPAALTSTITAPVPAPKAPTNRKRGSDNSLLKQTLVDSARKVSYPTTFQAPAASKPHPAGPFMGHPIPDSLKPMLTHRLKKPVAPLGSPFCPKEVPAWVTNRRQDDPETEEGANKRSKASGEWERRVARTQAASRRLQDVVAMAEAVELPSAVYAQRRNKRVGRKLRGIDLDLPRLR